LLSVSSKRGLLAAAGPSQLVIAETKAVRDSFTGPGKIEDNIKEFTPALTIDVPRLSQVAFNSDGSYLIICAESGGGLAVYDTAALLQNKTESAFQIGTSQIAVRALSPNPAPEFAHLVAVVLGGGQLMIANLQTKEFVSGNKAVKEGVTSVSWSNKGKQLVAGLGDGTAFQMDPAGSPKAIIPQPPNVPPNHHVSTIVWLANEEFLMIHTPNTPPEADRPPDSIIHYVQTDKGRTGFNYQTVNDPAGPFGLNRTPPIHYISRLRGWHSLTDMLILSAVDSTDIGLITQSAAPLAGGAPTGVYTGTSFADDSQRAGIPMSALGEMTDTSPIGMALDLSSTDKVSKPILGDEMEESPFPLPGLLLLNNEGILCGWWVVNKAAVRENKMYPGLIVAEGTVSTSTPAPAAMSSPQASPFGAPSAFGSASTFGKPAAPAFGQPTFGNAGNVGFGGASLLGQKPSPWGAASSGTSMAAPAQPGFGKPAFGAPSAFGAAVVNTQPGFGKPAFGSPSAFGAAASTGTAFGATGGIGQKASPWGTAPTSSGAASTASPFGSSAGGASGFAKFGSGAQTASPFGAMASGATSTPAFAASGTTMGGTPSTSFGMSTQPSFGSTVTIDSSAGGSTLGSKSIFGNTTPAQPSSLFGAPSLPQAQSQETDMMDDGDEKEVPKEENKTGGLFGGFKISSTFKPDTTSKDESDEEEDTRPAPRKSLFGADFGAAVPDQKQPASPKIKVEESEKPSLFGIPIKTEPTKTESTKPSLFGFPTKTETAKTEPTKTEPTKTEPTKTESTKPSLFGFPTKPETTKTEPTKTEPAKKGLFGFGTPSSSSPFGKPSSPLAKEPEPPQVTSKPEPPQSATTAASSASKASSSGDGESGSPLAGSEPGLIEMPESDAESSEGEPEVEPEAALPPDPTTMKVPKDFYNFNPNAPSTKSLPQPNAAAQLKPKPPVEKAPEIEPEAALPPDPTTMKVPKDFYNFNPNALPPKSAPQPKSSLPSAPQADSLFGSTTTTPHGFPKAPTIFAPPAPALRESPRSPSPVRSVTAPISRLTNNQAQRPPSRPISRQSQRPTLQPEPSYTASDLSDEADERIRLELAKPIEPTLKLEPFIAHQDYAGVAPKNDIGHAIERIFRDINSMVDTLGLNARSLSAFIEGHKTLGPDERNKDDLDDEDADEWTLVEIDQLGRIESELEQELDNEDLEEVKDKLAELDAVKKDLGRLRHKLQDIRKFLEQSKNPERKASLKNAPLDPAHKLAQQELRDSFAGFQAKLAEAEEGVLVLKTKLASANGARGGQVPTVEAVERTIRKMTEMAEKKSGDIDVLEAQMRRLGMNTSGQGSPARPSSSRAYTTENSTRSSRLMGESFRSSRGFGDSTRSSRFGASLSLPAKGKTFAFPDDEDDEAFKESVEQLRKAQSKKAWVLKTLAQEIRKKGTKINQG
jgi:nucleoporin NUP159